MPLRVEQLTCTTTFKQNAV